MLVNIQQLGREDVALMEKVCTLFGEVFGDLETYTARRPSPDYLRRLLGGDAFIALAALKDKELVGAVAAYELKKFEQERSEIYIYDLAVQPGCRREGVATALIARLGEIAAARGAYVMFVQADTGEEDAAAIALYSKLGVREEVLHFDIAPGIGDGRRD